MGRAAYSAADFGYGLSSGAGLSAVGGGGKKIWKERAHSSER